MTSAWPHPLGWNSPANRTSGLPTHLAVLVFTLLAATGCWNRQAPVNPFLSADRVPCPGTRAIPPGAVQPYYDGAPAPALPPGTIVPQTAPPVYPPQGSLAPAPQSSVQQATFTTPAAGEQVTPPAVQVAHNVPTANIASPGEGAVAVPSDGQALRIMSPEPAPFVAQAPAPIRPAAPAVTAELRPITTGASTLAPTNQATYVTGSPGPSFSPAPQSSDGLPWISGSAPRQAAAPQAFAQQGVSPLQSGLVPVVAPAPRVRLPGYPAPQQTFVVPSGVNPSSGASNYGQVQITELPSQSPLTAPAGTIPQVANDGFRARDTRF